MIKHSSKITALLLCLTLVLGLTSCFGGDNEAGSTGDGSDVGGTATAGAMGRYVEQEEYLPEEVLFVVAMSQLPDSSLRVMGDLGGQGIGPYGIYTSTDGAKSWTPVDYPWLDGLTGCEIYAAALTAEGAYLSRSENLLMDAKMPTDGAKAEAEPAESGEGSDEAATAAATGSETETKAEASANEPAQDRSGNDIPYTVVYGDASGVTEIDLDYLPEGEGVRATRLYTAANGDLLSVGLTAQIRQIDTNTLKEKANYQGSPAIGIAPGVATYDGTLAIHSADTINLYDLESGNQTGEISTIGGTQGDYLANKVATVSIPPDGSAYFYANASGIYRVPMGTTVSERLVDGGLCTLSNQTLDLTHVFSVGNDEYLTLVRTRELTYRLFRYTYNPDIPTEPSQALNVYSLYDNKTIRHAISGYQIQHPDIRVNYQVGLPEGSSVTAADAMRTLSTELLAGKGPDVIVMDDMNVDGYIQKNILQDLSDVVSGTKTLSNITNSFHQEGSLYAIPARFYIPMLMGDDIEDVKNLSDFTAWLDNQYTADIGIRSDELVDRFYRAFSNGWFAEDASLDETAFRSDLEQLGKLSEGIRALDEVNSFGNIAVDTLVWYGGATAANYSIVGGYVDVGLFDVTIKNRPTASYHSFPNDSGDVFIPGTILGINAATGSLDSSKSFVQHVLSYEVQNTNLGDGFPVNDEAFEALSKNPGGDIETENMLMQLSVNDARTGEMIEVSLSGAWPSDEFMTEFKSTLRSAHVPVKANAVIKEMIIDETAAYIGGQRSLDDTVRSFKQKMDLYLSE